MADRKERALIDGHAARMQVQGRGIDSDRHLLSKRIDPGPQLLWVLPQHEFHTLVLTQQVNEDPGRVTEASSVVHEHFHVEVAFHLSLRIEIECYGARVTIHDERQWSNVFHAIHQSSLDLLTDEVLKLSIAIRIVIDGFDSQYFRSKIGFRRQTSGEDFWNKMPTSIWALNPSWNNNTDV